MLEKVAQNCFLISERTDTKLLRRLMMKNLTKQGLVEQADTIFSSMDNGGWDRLLNHVAARALLKKQEIVNARPYSSKIYERNFCLDEEFTA
jgi:pentatricopeptide repeat protein